MNAGKVINGIQHLVSIQGRKRKAIVDSGELHNTHLMERGSCYSALTSVSKQELFSSIPLKNVYISLNPESREKLIKKSGRQEKALQFFWLELNLTIKMET